MVGSHLELVESLALSISRRVIIMIVMSCDHIKGKVRESARQE